MSGWCGRARRGQAARPRRFASRSRPNQAAAASLIVRPTVMPPPWSVTAVGACAGAGGAVARGLCRTYFERRRRWRSAPRPGRARGSAPAREHGERREGRRGRSCAGSRRLAGGGLTVAAVTVRRVRVVRRRHRFDRRGRLGAAATRVAASSVMTVGTDGSVTSGAGLRRATTRSAVSSACSACPSAAASSPADPKRSCGRLAIALAMIASSCSGISGDLVAGRRDRVVDVRVDLRDVRRPIKRHMPGQRLEQHAAERVDVRRRVSLAAMIRSGAV